MEIKNLPAPKKIFITLECTALLLLGAYLLLLFSLPNFSAATYGGVAALFNFNAEVSIPTWFSQSILLISAGLLFFIGSESTAQKKLWKGLGVIFIYLSIDEGASIHELTVFPMRNLLGIESGPFYYSWVVLFGVISVIIAMIYAKFFFKLPPRTRGLILASAALFISGAIGFEMLGGGIAAEYGESGIIYSLLVATEEFLEITGTTLFIYALTDYTSKKLQTTTAPRADKVSATATLST